MRLPLDADIANYREDVRFDGDGVSVQFRGDAQPLLDQNARIRSGFDHRKSRKLGWELIASLDPCTMMEIYAKTGIRAWKKEDTKRLFKLFNDTDWKYLRTVDGLL